jgi:hypothetical protein
LAGFRFDEAGLHAIQFHDARFSLEFFQKVTFCDGIRRQLVAALA